MSTATVTSTYGVDGMTCGHCVHHVREEVTALPGVQQVTVELVVGGSSPLTVVSDAPLDEAAVAAAVAEAGYALTPARSLL